VPKLDRQVVNLANFGETRTCVLQAKTALAGQTMVP